MEFHFQKFFLYSITNGLQNLVDKFFIARFSFYINFQFFYKVFLPSYSDQKI